MSARYSALKEYIAFYELRCVLLAGTNTQFSMVDLPEEWKQVRNLHEELREKAIRQKNLIDATIFFLLIYAT